MTAFARGWWVLIAIGITSMNAWGEETRAPTSVFHSIDEKLSEGKSSIYSDRIFKVLQKWPPANIPDKSTKPIWMAAVRTPGKSLYIGLEKQILIQAPISRVAGMIEKFEDYPELFPEVKKVEVRERDGNKITVFWERYSPAFFIPNIKYEQIYLIDHQSDKRIIYRYQLKSGNSLNFSDGIVVLESVGDSTRLTAWDFYDASWGILGAVATGKIWKESMEGSYKGDLAFKMRAEHPDWKQDQIKKETERTLDQFPVEPIQYLDRFEWD